MLSRFLTLEPLLLLALSVAAILGVVHLFGLSLSWSIAGTVAFLLFAWLPLSARLQDVLLEQYIGNGWFKRALTIASSIRDAAQTPLGRTLAEFDMGLVHLARGAPADAIRSFGRMEKHRLKPKTRSLVELYVALARLRATAGSGSEAAPGTESEEEGRAASAKALLAAVRAAESELGEDPHLLAAEAEARLALGEVEAARKLLTRSLNLDPDPRDPSPGERYVLFARAAIACGADETARRALDVAARLKANGPFTREARELLSGARRD